MTHQTADRTAWIRETHALFEGRLLRYATRLTGNAETGREVVQDTFLRLCDQQPDELNGRLAAWLFTVCRRRALDVLRKESRMSTLAEEQSAAVLTPELSPAESLETGETVAQVRRVLAGMTANQQEVVRLKFEEELSYREISQITGLSITNVGYLLHIALKTIRGEVRE